MVSDSESETEWEEVDLVPASDYGASTDTNKEDPCSDYSKLVRGEDDVLMNKEIASLVKDVLVPAEETEELDTSTEPRSHDPIGEKPRACDPALSQALPRTLAQILVLGRRGGAHWQHDLPSSRVFIACLKRLGDLAGEIKRFASQVRVAERILSSALVERPEQKQVNEWNWVSHQLAQAKQNSLLSAQRQTRAFGWFQATSQLCQEDPCHAIIDVKKG